jgi:hypothetical protein
MHHFDAEAGAFPLFLKKSTTIFIVFWKDARMHLHSLENKHKLTQSQLNNGVL